MEARRRSPLSFAVEHRSSRCAARAGTLHTPRGEVETPVFMPVGTRAAVKGILPDRLRSLGARILLANTYHLHLRPGAETVHALGGLHAMMAWEGPILTDSGGFQVFSLADSAQVDDEGVSFRSEVDGSAVRLDAERSLEIQALLGSDIAMVFDECPSTTDDRPRVETAVRRTLAWARRAREWHASRGGAHRGQALFGIVQGGSFADLRTECARALVDLDFDGYAIGGVCVGESKVQMHAAIEHSAGALPEEKPRYLMGIGTPEDFFTAVRLGVDMFDCVSPTRLGRMGIAFTRGGRIQLKNSRFTRVREPVEAECGCPCCSRYSAGTIRHLLKSNEMLGGILLSLHNLHFFLDLMQRIRGAIVEDRLEELQDEVLSRYLEPGPA